MASSIRALSEVAQDAVVEYFARRGVPPPTTRWKYFDREWDTRGRERGLAWVRDERVQGFLGLIPARMAREGHTADLTWTCDWSLAERTATPGIGIRLLQRAIELHPQLMSVTRGTDYTARIAPRIAHHTVPDAAPLVLIPLCAGAVIQAVGRRAGLNESAALFRLGRVPLQWLRRPRATVRVESEVPEAIAPLLEAPHGTGWSPHYDWNHLQWALVRCPALVCGTVLSPGVGSPRAAVVFWRRRDLPHSWRIALWMHPGEGECLGSALCEALRQVRAGGGWIVGLLLSRRDREFLTAVARGRFSFRRLSAPLYVLATGNPVVEELAGLSFLDADLASLF